MAIDHGFTTVSADGTSTAHRTGKDDVVDLTCGPPVCPANLLECSDQCIDPNTDESHCGACDAACGPGTVCTGGLCL